MMGIYGQGFLGYFLMMIMMGTFYIVTLVIFFYLMWRIVKAVEKIAENKQNSKE